MADLFSILTTRYQIIEGFSSRIFMDYRSFLELNPIQLATVAFFYHDSLPLILFTRHSSTTMGDNGDFVPAPVDLNKPLWDQGTYTGRLNYFLRVTNPLLLLKSKKEYEQARTLVLQARYIAS